jgi:nucleotide-binding universal stress UspA family protein
MATRILVPLDGSRLAEQALPCAGMLAKGLSAELILFRAVSLSPEIRAILDDADLETSVPLTPMVDEAKEYLSQVGRRLKEGGFQFQTAVGCGPPEDAILTSVEEQGISQIVMATHGYGGVSRWMHGSVAERVLLASRVPILLVRAQETAAAPPDKPMRCQRILVPLDGSAVAEQVLPVVTSVAKALDAQLVLLRVLSVMTSISLTGEWYMPLDDILETAHQEAQTYLDRTAKAMETEGLKVSIATVVGGVANAIINHAETNQVDLIAMCTHGRSGLARWALGSVADRVLRAGRIPLLLVRAR